MTVNIFSLSFFISLIILLNSCVRDYQIYYETVELDFCNDGENIDKLTPFFWGYSVNDDFFRDFNLIENDKLHPLDLGRISFFALHTGRVNNDTLLLNYGKSCLDFLIDYPELSKHSNSYIYNYPFNHREFEAGKWWSGMANSVIALAFLEGYEIFEKDIYFDYFTKTANGVILPVTENGSAVKPGDDALWYLEYVDKNSNIDNAYFVLNGFLFALLAIDIMYEKTNDSIYLDAYNKGLNAYNLYRNNYFYPDKSWTYYMLNPLTIESPHYAIYDLLLLKSLWISRPNNIFENEIKQRQQIIYNAYPVQKKQKQDSTVFIFSCIGPPHPYWIDVYDNIYTKYFYKSNLIKEQITAPRKPDIDIAERAFIIDTFKTATIDSIAIFSVYNKDTLYLYKTGVNNLKNIEADKYNTFAFNLSTHRNARKISNNKLEIFLSDYESVGKLNRGTIELNIRNKLDIDKNNKFGIIISPEHEIISLMITLFDDELNWVNRYYVAPQKDTSNLILLNKLGFNNIERINTKSIERVRIDVFVDGMNYGDKFIIELGDNIVGFENNFQLYKYFTTNNFYFPEHTKRGNIY